MRIGELATRLGLNPKTIRFYEAGGLLPEPERTASGYRTYTRTDAERITFIKTAQRLGMSLDEIREILAFRDRGQPPCTYVRQALRDQVAGIDQRIAELVRLREQLIALDEKTQHQPEGEGYYCGIIEHAQPDPPGQPARPNCNSTVSHSAGGASTEARGEPPKRGSHGDPDHSRAGDRL